MSSGHDEDVDKLTEQIVAANDYMVNRETIKEQVEAFDDMLASLEGIGCGFEAVDLSDSFEVSGEAYTSCTFTLVKNDVAQYTASDPWVNKYHGAENAIERFIEANEAGEMLFGTTRPVPHPGTRMALYWVPWLSAVANNMLLRPRRP